MKNAKRSLPDVTVTWMADARRDLGDNLCHQLGMELLVAFALHPMNGTSLVAQKDASSNSGDPPEQPRPASKWQGNNYGVQIVVKQRFRGFSDEPLKKIILAVEVQSPEGVHSGVVKIGDSDQVGGDYTGWQSCAGSRGVASRMFIAPVRRDVGDNRVAIIYPDVYQYYFDNGRDDEPKELETIVEQSILRNSPTSTSVERVLTQVFTEAYRCFYRNAQVDATHHHVMNAVTRSLEFHKSPTVLERWQQDEYVKLRRGAAWLTSVNRMPDSVARPEYVDPVDYLKWVLGPGERLGVSPPCAGKNGVGSQLCEAPEGLYQQLRPDPVFASRLPEMLVGPAHGDLHGRNVIVGVVRGEAEWPAVFDFDKMNDTNLVAWDFAKLELELKCRLFPQLLESPGDRQQLRQLLGIPEIKPLPKSLKLSPDDARVQQRIERMQIMFAIEQCLHRWSTSISSLGEATRADVEFEPAIPADTALGRAMRIIFRIRREAAVALGYQRQGRESRWRDEYYFALTTYGVVCAKWHSASDHLAWCLMSAGVAAANLSQLPWSVDPMVNPVAGCDPASGGRQSPDTASPDFSNVASYQQLLPYAYTCWKQKRPSEPVRMLEAAIKRFPYAVALKQQLVLSLVESDNSADEEKARREIEDFFTLACVFRDHEFLCRFGRIYKDKGDRQLDENVTHQEVIEGKLPAYQHYLVALYYYETAYDITGNYYPAINAASLALLVGDHEKQKSLAEQILTICARLPLNDPNQTWILATEGEASLLVGRTESATRFYRAALERILAEETGTIDSIYKQLRRLQWALGEDVVGPVMEIIKP